MNLSQNMEGQTLLPITTVKGIIAAGALVGLSVIGVYLFLRFTGRLKKQDTKTVELKTEIKQPVLNYGNVIVRYSRRKEHGGEYQFSTYLLEIKDEVNNTESNDCSAKVDLSSVKIARYYGKWEISNEVTISIATEEIIYQNRI